MPQEKVVRMLDGAALSRVFANLLQNAVKYSSGDLEITLESTGEIVFANTAPGLDEIQVGRLLQHLVQDHGLRGGVAFPGKEDRVPEQLLRHRNQQLGTVPDDIEITFGNIRFFLLLQQVQITADCGQGRPQIMGEIRDCAGAGCVLFRKSDLK